MKKKINDTMRNKPLGNIRSLESLRLLCFPKHYKIAIVCCFHQKLVYFIVRTGQRLGLDLNLPITKKASTHLFIQI